MVLTEKRQDKHMKLRRTFHHPNTTREKVILTMITYFISRSKDIQSGLVSFILLSLLLLGSKSVNFFPASGQSVFFNASRSFGLVHF